MECHRPGRGLAMVAVRLARPGGNSTGFTAFEYSLSGKWLELLKEICAQPDYRIAILRDPALAAGIGQLPPRSRQAMAPSSFAGVELSPDRRARRRRDRARRSLHWRASQIGGLIVTGSSSAARFIAELIVMLAARGIGCLRSYPFRYFITKRRPYLLRA